MSGISFSLRRALLTLHVGSSVGGMGAVASFLVLALNGLRAPASGPFDYGVLDILGTQMILPLCLAALATGVVQSLVAKWGLTKHYWVLVKLLLTVITILVLLVQLPGIAALADLNANGESLAAYGALRFSVVLHASGGLIVLAAVLILSIVKPAGKTPWEVRRTQGPPDLQG